MPSHAAEIRDDLKIPILIIVSSLHKYQKASKMTQFVYQGSLENGAEVASYCGRAGALLAVGAFGVDALVVRGYFF